MNKQLTMEVSGGKIPGATVIGDSSTVRRSEKGFWSKKGSENRRLRNE